MDNQLIIHIRNGDEYKVKELLDAGVSPNNNSITEESPLRVAAELNNIDLIKLLIKYGADLNNMHYADPDYRSIIWHVDEIEVIEDVYKRVKFDFVKEFDASRSMVNSIFIDYLTKANRNLSQRQIDIIIGSQTVIDTDKMTKFQKHGYTITLNCDVWHRITVKTPPESIEAILKMYLAGLGVNPADIHKNLIILMNSYNFIRSDNVELLAQELNKYENHGFEEITKALFIIAGGNLKMKCAMFLSKWVNECPVDECGRTILTNVTLLSENVKDGYRELVKLFREKNWINIADNNNKTVLDYAKTSEDGLFLDVLMKEC